VRASPLSPLGAALAVGVLLACGQGGSDGPAPRPFLLASTGIVAAPGAAWFFPMTAANLAEDVDVVSVHQDFYGVPWDAFLAGRDPPAQWVAILDAIRSTYAGRRIFLSLQLAGGPGRAHLADKAWVDASGVLHVDQAWSARCYDLAAEPGGAALRAAWARYVAWMVEEFDPEWVNVGVELNMFAVQCPAAWPGMVAAERAGYDAAKAARPGVIAFPSIQLDVLYGRQLCTGGLGSCYEANLAQLAGLARDRFAVSLYPQGDPVWRHPAEVDADYLTRAADRAGGRLLVAETGWDSSPLAGTLAGTCETPLAFSEADTDGWLARVLDAAESRQADLVTWWSNWDLIPAAVSVACSYDSTWQPVVDVFRSTGGSDPLAQFLGELTLKVFGTMGIRDDHGTPKGAAFRRWKKAQARPAAAGLVE
jgi:hypothetical protein